MYKPAIFYKPCTHQLHIPTHNSITACTHPTSSSLLLKWWLSSYHCLVLRGPLENWSCVQGFKVGMYACMNLPLILRPRRLANILPHSIRMKPLATLSMHAHSHVIVCLRHLTKTISLEVKWFDLTHRFVCRSWKMVWDISCWNTCSLVPRLSGQLNA